MRYQDWPERLDQFISFQDHSFDWSTCNCALFAADGVKAITGVDFAEPYRGPKTKRGMISKLARVCGGGVEEAATRELGEPWSSPLQAKRGDVVSADLGDGPALGICLGVNAAFIAEDKGVVLVPSKLWRFAWRVE